MWFPTMFITALISLTDVSRTRASKWTLLDSFNEVFPLEMRQFAAQQFNDYYNHKNTVNPDSVPKYVIFAPPQAGSFCL